ncbi:NADH-dependent flavin oxidoreductase [Paenibacillus harenae]|uniref:NADH-dependent flavin oxidoreductase n=1 Tax=Paenibacillus harenae TaxID=306543 RepID=UPI0027905DF9|nr:NADH-dependent flavin oxidoreductase [Paenibacillus harenae]MDQ0058616.1 2,4-dienoyl-CoA reductase-like NADH-dependent reductase (Old Yellow Enzyme family) [Paenibacillus harenae]
MKEQYKPLFESFTFKSGVHVKNKIVMAPMTNFSSREDGSVSDDEVRYYERRSNGVGMVITACIYVSPNGKGFPGQFAGDRDEMIPSMKRLAASIKEKGAKAVLQIYHGGRECPVALVPGGDVVSASAVASEQNGGVVPRELAETEIEAIVGDFGAATRRAIEAGFDGVEIHGANGYLLQQFFSEQSNKRNDRFGGDIDRRLAFPLAIVDEVKRVVGEHAKEPFLVGYRFLPEEATTPGITMEHTFRLVDELAAKELDYLHISLMEADSLPRRGAEPTKSRLAWIQDRVGHLVPIIGVGSIRTPEEALRTLDVVPFVAIGRELIMEPEWVEKVQSGREEQIRTKLSRNGQEDLVVPTPLWEVIVRPTNWFPIGD